MPTSKRSTQLIILALLIIAAFLLILNNVSAKSIDFSILGITITPTDDPGKVTLTPTTDPGKVTLTPTSGNNGGPTKTPGRHPTPVPHPVTPGGSGNSGIVLFSTLFLVAVMFFAASFFIKRTNKRPS